MHSMSLPDQNHDQQAFVDAAVFPGEWNSPQQPISESSFTVIKLHDGLQFLQYSL
jgi:hypothetical protein